MRTLLGFVLLATASCGPGARQSGGSGPAAPAEPAADDGDGDARDRFFAAMSELCGRRFEGRAVYMAEPREPFDGARLVMEVASCDDREIRIPFLVGEDASRTWVLTRTPEGLLFEHDHRHPDGTPEEITDYGGFATADGCATRQRFPAHEATARMIPEAATNVWTLELRPADKTFVYDLDRHGAPRFRALFAIE